MNENNFRNILFELIEENPFAIRAVLRILSIEFSTKIPTLCVTREERPRLMVNLDFVNQNCRTDAQVKAVICHEFLHILLRHTETRGTLTESEHLAMDAVINAIIDRELGKEYSAMMTQYYQKSPGLARLLRPLNFAESAQLALLSKTGNAPQWMLAWEALYQGKLVVDDIKELADDLNHSDEGNPNSRIISSLLGGHDVFNKPLPKALEDALDQAMKTMNGHGIWRSPQSRGLGATGYDAVFSSSNIKLEAWVKATSVILKKYLLPDKQARHTIEERKEYFLPVLSPRDRRAFFRATWNPYMPEANWENWIKRSGGLAQVYLDVSGSMHSEMPFIISLLGRLRQYIKMPFWAFSNEVAPAKIESGQLITRTTGGTSMMCVLEHIAKTKPLSAVVITDGYIEELAPQDVYQIRHTKLHAVVSRDGNAESLTKAGIDYSQLERIPE